VERVSEIPVSADWSKPEVCIIELGGTIGDIEGMAFVEAFRYTPCSFGFNLRK
jgi:CTP synthase